MIPQNENEPIKDLHAFSRITSVIGILLANGRKQEFNMLWEYMMDTCCREFLRKVGDGSVDFSVKEIMLAYIAMKDKVSPVKRESWRVKLAGIDPLNDYTSPSF